MGGIKHPHLINPHIPNPLNPLKTHSNSPPPRPAHTTNENRELIPTVATECQYRYLSEVGYENAYAAYFALVSPKLCKTLRML